MKRFIAYKLCLLAVGVLCLTACDKSGKMVVSATGSIYECLVVGPTSVYDPIKEVMAADMPCLPQMEPYFTTMHVTPTKFDSYLKPSRNILWADIDSVRYSQVKAKVSQDPWSHPQVMYHIQAPSVQAFLTYWQEHGEQVRAWFVEQEIQRQVSFYRASTNKQARQRLQEHFGVDMWIPEDYMLIMDTTLVCDQQSVNLLWCCNNKGPMRRDVVVYAYPYTSTRTFTLDYLCQQRDKVLGKVITASVPGSYMGTEYRIFPPQMEVKNDVYEVRGLWKILGGEAMGGPYVSHTILDSTKTKVITAEIFLYAAGQKKRNALRQGEAVIASLRSRGVEE